MMDKDVNTSSVLDYHSNTTRPFYKTDHTGNDVFNCAITVYLFILSLGITVSNVGVIRAILKYKFLHKKTYFIQSSLAVADLLVGVVTIPFYLAWLHSDVLYSNTKFCMAILSFCLFIKTATILNLLSLTTERYLAICHPLLHKRGSSFHNVTGKVIGSTWIISILATVVSTFGIDQEFTQCIYYKVFQEDFLLVAIITGVFLPYAMMIVMYVKMFLSFNKHLKNIYQTLITGNEYVTMDINRRKMLARRKMMLTFCLIFIVFGIAWLPFFVAILIQISCSACYLPEEVNEVILLFGFSHSLANPVIYAVRQKTLRMSIFKTYACGRKLSEARKGKDESNSDRL